MDLGLILTLNSAFGVGSLKSKRQTLKRSGEMVCSYYFYVCGVNSLCYIALGFPKRTNQQHRDLADQYRILRTKQARKDFAAANSTRWTELARLPYFDTCRMIVIDPMHNLFLGVPNYPMRLLDIIH